VPLGSINAPSRRETGQILGREGDRVAPWTTRGEAGLVGVDPKMCHRPPGQQSPSVGFRTLPTEGHVIHATFMVVAAGQLRVVERGM
jgi:hypothetical protein